MTKPKSAHAVDDLALDACAESMRASAAALGRADMLAATNTPTRSAAELFRLAEMCRQAAEDLGKSHDALATGKNDEDAWSALNSAIGTLNAITSASSGAPQEDSEEAPDRKTA